MRPKCPNPKCYRYGIKMGKAGKPWSGHKKVQQYRCHGCSYVFIDSKGLYGFPKEVR